jgi:hypothetical protein
MLSVEKVVRLVQAGLDKRPPVFDLTALGHFFEQCLAPIALQKLAPKAYEGAMDVGGRKRSGYSVDVGGRHEISRFDFKDPRDPPDERKASSL